MALKASVIISLAIITAIKVRGLNSLKKTVNSNEIGLN